MTYKHLFLLLVTISIATTASAKKAYYSIEMMVAYADVIVVGEIENVGINSYRFSISQTIKGDQDESIRVQKFKEWTCDVRPRKFEIGQKMVLFLEKKLGKYELVNGSSGETYIDDNIVQIRILNGKPTTAEFTGMLTDFLSCYTPNNEPDSIWNTIYYTQIVSDDEITEIRLNSKYSDWLIGSVEDQINK